MTQIDNTTRQLLQHPIKRRAWIKYQFHVRGLSMAQVAADAGVSRSCLYSVFKKSYPRMEKVVADALDLTPKQLWPERYDKDGLPIYRMGRPKKSVTKKTQNNTTGNVQERRVA